MCSAGAICFNCVRPRRRGGVVGKPRFQLGFDLDEILGLGLEVARIPQDRSRISLLEPHEVQYWADKFNVSKERLSEAVKNVGHSADAVERELKRLA
jgi:hypothetical protein